MQFITSIKLQELEKQRLAYEAHSEVIAAADAAGDDWVSRVEILLEGVRAWNGSGALPERGVVGSKLDLRNLDLWLLQAKKDPSFHEDVLKGWAETLEIHIKHSRTRFDYAKLFGNLFNEWLSSGDSVTAGATVNEARMDTDVSFVEIGRKELHDQRDRLESIIFSNPNVDTEELFAYLTSLFADAAPANAFVQLRAEIEDFGVILRTKVITSHDVRWTISSLLSSDLMTEEKRNTLKEFTENPAVLDEVASVLNMRLASLESWSWPEGGLEIEMRRHLNGKYRAFTDPEILDGLFLQYLGISWQIKFKEVFRDVFKSKAWKSALPAFPKAKIDNRSHFFGEDAAPQGIESHRQQDRENYFLVSQLPDNTCSIPSYDDSSSPDSAVTTKQRLLHILLTECHLNTALHGTHTVLRTDLEWFGPSLPHDSIITVLAFFGVSQQWLDFFRTFLRAPLRFKEEPSAELRTRERGTPISYALSGLCGEAILFVMDFAVNQRADGLFLYRLHDDIWLWDSYSKKCVAAWQEMKRYASLAGMKFNDAKTGTACVNGIVHPDLPSGDIRWGFLKFDSAEERFVIDQESVSEHIMELRRQLSATRSVFGMINAYNKYLKFFTRNFAGRPAFCFGRELVDEAIDTLARIQKELFPGADGGMVGHLRRMITDRFGVTNLPQGYFYFPISCGGLELHDPMIEYYAVRESLKCEPQKFFVLAKDEDVQLYDALKESWENKPTPWLVPGGLPPPKFPAFEDYVSHPARLVHLHAWKTAYIAHLMIPAPRHVTETPFIQAALKAGWIGVRWWKMTFYEKWIVSMFGEEVAKVFGRLEVVDPALIPVGMVGLFKTSRMRWEQ
jgi:hypothetical protein